MKKKNNNAPVYHAVGAIVPDALYRLDEAKARMGWRDAAFRSAVRAGLKTYRAGKRLYLLGSDIIDFVVSRKGENMCPNTSHTCAPQPHPQPVQAP